MIANDPKPFIFKKFSQKGPGVREKYLWAGNQSFVVHGDKCLVLKGVGTLMKCFLEGEG